MRSRSKVRQVAIRLVCALVFTGFGLPGSAMGADDFPPAVGVADRAEILTWICETLSARYVEPEVARAMVDEVRARAAAGAYDTLDAADAFLLALEQDLRAASNDSGQTFSAAEDFAYGLQQAGRATVIGERSKGGGHPVGIVRMIRDDMAVAMQVPNAKSVHRKTGTSWEGVGVVPDVEVTASRALEAAYEAAAAVLLERVDGEDARRRVEWARQEFRAGLRPVMLSRDQLREYAGQYEGRSVSVGSEDVLLYHRDVGSSRPMVPMGGDLFRFEGYDGVRLQFERDDSGRVDRVVALSPDGSRTVRRRSD